MNDFMSGLDELYRDLHAHPELGFQEHRTAGIVADRLAGLGYATETGVGDTGVVGVLRAGDGPVVMLRADMDALPVSSLPSNHSPLFAPVIEPTLRTGVGALTCAALAWLS